MRGAPRMHERGLLPREPRDGDVKNDRKIQILRDINGIVKYHESESVHYASNIGAVKSNVSTDIQNLSKFNPKCLISVCGAER